MQTTRRRFLSMSLCLLAGARARLVVAWEQAGGDQRTAVLELSGHFHDLPSVVRIGRAAAAALPEGADPSQLLALIDPGRRDPPIEQEVRMQYRRGETVEVGADLAPWRLAGRRTGPPGTRGDSSPDGPWTFALTEARVFALIASAAERGILEHS